MCASATQLESVLILVVDNYGPQDRALLGLPPIAWVGYSVGQNLALNIAFINLTAVVNATVWLNSTGQAAQAPAAWVAVVPASVVGLSIATLRTSIQPLAASPTLLHVDTPSCASGRVLRSDGSCICPSATALTGPLDPGTCQPLYSIPAIIGGAPGATLLTVLLAAAFFYYRLSRWARLADTSWLVGLSRAFVLALIWMKWPLASRRVSCTLALFYACALFILSHDKIFRSRAPIFPPTSLRTFSVLVSLEPPRPPPP